jgi:hypothetical protein
MQDPFFDVDFRPGDIIFTRDDSKLSRLIRKFSTSYKEDPSIASHTALVYDHGRVIESAVVTRIKTLKEFRERNKAGISVWRADISVENAVCMQNRCLRWVGKKYPVWKLFPHVADWYLSMLQGKLFGKITHPTFFRRLCKLNAYPICSWLVAYAYDECVKKDFFGVPVWSAQPDCIHDWCVVNGKHIYSNKEWYIGV